MTRSACSRSSTRSRPSPPRPARRFRRSRSIGCSAARTVANVIIGARNEAQLLENVGAVGWKLTPEQIAKLDAASHVHPPYPVWHQRESSILNEKAAQG